MFPGWFFWYFLVSDRQQQHTPWQFSEWFLLSAQLLQRHSGHRKQRGYFQKSKSENTARYSLQQKFLQFSVTLKKGKKYLCAKVFGLQRYILYADPCLNCPKISHSVQQNHNHWQYLILLPLEWWNMTYIFIFLELLGFRDIK